MLVNHTPIFAPGAGREKRPQRKRHINFTIYGANFLTLPDLNVMQQQVIAEQVKVQQIEKEQQVKVQVQVLHSVVAGSDVNMRRGLYRFRGRPR